MLRFINLSDQICESIPEFAFYDTVTDSFKTFSGFQTWKSVEDFVVDYEGDDLSRYLDLIPDNILKAAK